MPCEASRPLARLCLQHCFLFLTKASARLYLVSSPPRAALVPLLFLPMLRSRPGHIAIPAVRECPLAPRRVPVVTRHHAHSPSSSPRERTWIPLVLC